MDFDRQGLISNDQTLVGVAATEINSSDVIDLRAAGTVPHLGGSPPQDIGRGVEIPFVMKITTTVLAAGGAANVTFKLVVSAATALTGATVLFTSGAIAKATLVAGYLIRGRCIIPGGNLRYLGGIYTPDTNDTTAGKIWAHVGGYPHTSPGSFV